jgi:phosphate transport system protein
MDSERTDRVDIRHRFEAELDAIKQGTVRLGSLVLENAKRLTEALLENRLDLAQEVIDRDEEIDQAYVALEHRSFKVMALQQPVAGDLRFLVSITRMLYEIERSGDLVANTAKGLIRQHGYNLSPALTAILSRLAQASTEVFAEGIDALASMDPTAGTRLDKRDDEVDALVGEFYTLLGVEAEEMNVNVAIELSRAGRYLERISDHAVNIAEHMTFVATGVFPRHDTPPAE